MPLFAASPSAGTISADSPTITWNGGPLLSPTALACSDAAAILCDQFALTIVSPNQPFVVTIRIAAARLGDDIDLLVRDPNGNTVAMSGTSGGVEEVVLASPPAGTYTVVVQPFLVLPGPTATYSGSAAIGSPAQDELSNSYHGALYTANFVGVPSSAPARSSPLVPQLKVSFNYVGRPAAEPTIGVDKNNTGFFPRLPLTRSSASRAWLV